MDWKRLVPWKVLSLKARPEGSLVPVAYGSNVFPTRLGRGSRLWVVTRASPDDPYSLVARLRLQEVRERGEMEGWWPPGTKRLFEQWKTVALASPHGSRFFQTNDADADLADLGVRFYGPFSYLESSQGAFSRSMRQARRTVFLSYKWAEEEEFARHLASELRAQKLSPWFDALAIPEYDEKREPVVEERLRELIRRAIGRSRLAVILNSPEYGRTGWTSTEWNLIREGGIRCFQVMLGGRPRNGAEIVENGTPDVVAASIQRDSRRPRR